MGRRKNPFKGRQFTSEVILWAVRWYLQFPISYRDLERMLADRGVNGRSRPSRWWKLEGGQGRRQSGRHC